MKLYILMSCLIMTSSAQPRCNGVRFYNKYYDVQILKEGINRIHQMVFNRNDNTIYFTLDQIAVVPTRVLGYLNLDTREAGLIEGIRNATAVTIDHAYNIVYIGGSDGVYKLNGNHIPESLPIRDDIRSVFFKNVLFYTNRRQEAFVYQNGHIIQVFELQGVDVDSLVLDDDNNIFFTKGRNLFRVKIGTRAVNSLESYAANLLTVDSNYKSYVGTKDGVYVYNKYKYVLDKVADLSNLRALTFDKDNKPIFAILDSIYMFNATVNCVPHID